MTFVKGQSGNTTGLSPLALRKIKMIEGLTAPAIRRLGALIEDEDKRIAISAIDIVLKRTIPVPKPLGGAALAAAAAGGAMGGHMAAMRAQAERRLAADDAKTIEVDVRTVSNGVE